MGVAPALREMASRPRDALAECASPRPPTQPAGSPATTLSPAAIDEQFTQLWAQHERYIVKRLRREAQQQGLENQLDDLVQEVKLALLLTMRHNGLFATEVYLRNKTRAWLTTVSNHKLVDAVRERNRQADRPVSEVMVDSAGQAEPTDSSDCLEQLLGPLDENDGGLMALRRLHWHEVLQVVTRLMQGLPPGQREALVLVGVRQAGTAEAAQHLGVSPGTVKSQVNEARAKLRQRLTDWEWDA